MLDLGIELFLLTGDFVILSPRNYMVMAVGTSDEVSYGNSYLQGMNTYDQSLIQPGSRKPDITAEDLVTSLREQETDTRFFETNLVDYELDIGGEEPQERIVKGFQGLVGIF